MAQVFYIHNENPQLRLLRLVAECLQDGGVVVYPTDSAYAVGCMVGHKQALDRIRQLRQLNDKHFFTLICRDLSELSTYAHVDNQTYRLLKACTPGPYTFILKAGREAPRLLMHPKRRTIGIRVPQHIVLQGILEVLQHPLISTTLQLPGEEWPEQDPEEMVARVGKQVDVIVNAGYGPREETTVVDCTLDSPTVLRVGLGDSSIFSL